MSKTLQPGEVIDLEAEKQDRLLQDLKAAWGTAQTELTGLQQRQGQVRAAQACATTADDLLHLRKEADELILRIKAASLDAATAELTYRENEGAAIGRDIAAARAMFAQLQEERNRLQARQLVFQQQGAKAEGREHDRRGHIDRLREKVSDLTEDLRSEATSVVRRKQVARVGVRVAGEKVFSV